MNDRSETNKVAFLVSHESHPRAPLLQFARDRRNYLHRLRVFKTKSKLSILDYLLTPKRIFLLLNAADLQTVSVFMHQLQGVTACDYARRKSAKGPFWKGRFQITLIQQGGQVFQCMLAMAGQLSYLGHVFHPAEWLYAGYHELTKNRQRYRIIDQKKLLNGLAEPTVANFREFREEYIINVDEQLSLQIHNPLEAWQSALAVGSRNWIDRIAENVPKCNQTMFKCVSNNDTGSSWMIKTSQANQRYYLKKYLNLISVKT